MTCYLNGRILPLEDASIHPFDRGFVYGDGVYEVVKILDGSLLFLGEHLERLAEGLEIVRISVPHLDDLAQVCPRLVEEAGIGTGSIYLQVTRGAGPRTHIPPQDLTPTVFAAPQAHEHPGAERLEGCGVVTTPDVRWGRCDVKTTSLMATVLGKLQARDASAREVLFVGPEGDVREGGSSAVFVRRGDVLETHPSGRRILPSITRRVVLELARREGLPVVERAPRSSERNTWQEAFLCGTLTTVWGVTSLDGAAVGTGEVGPWTRRLMSVYDAYERREAQAVQK